MRHACRIEQYLLVKAIKQCLTSGLPHPEPVAFHDKSKYSITAASSLPDDVVSCCGRTIVGAEGVHQETTWRGVYVFCTQQHGGTQLLDASSLCLHWVTHPLSNCVLAAAPCLCHNLLVRKVREPGVCVCVSTSLEPCHGHQPLLSTQCMQRTQSTAIPLFSLSLLSK